MNMRLPARRNGASATAKRKRLVRGVEILKQAAESIQTLAESIDEEFLVAVDKLLSMRGSLIVCGIGKAGLIGKKLAATFSSTGTRAHFLHPAEAVHGDLGRVGPADVVLMLSNSGATEEIVRILPFMVRHSAGLIAITSGANSPLARVADIVLVLPPCKEACRHNLAPSTSTTAMLALGDALALVVSEARVRGAGLCCIAPWRIAWAQIVDRRGGNASGVGLSFGIHPDNHPENACRGITPRTPDRCSDVG